MRRLAVLLLLLLPGLALAQVTPTTRFLWNTVPPLTAATNTPVVMTITGIANTRVTLVDISAKCSGGTASLTVTDGGSTVWTDTGVIGTTWGGLFWLTRPYSAGLGTTVVITLGTCGVGNTGTLIVRAEQG